MTFLSDQVEVTGFSGIIFATFNGTPQEFVCVDLFTGISYGDYDSNAILPRPGRHEDRAAWLFVNSLGGVNTSQLGQAFQFAIWDIIHDGGDGLANGRIQSSANTDAAVAQSAEDYILLSLGKSSTAASIYLNAALTTGEPAQAFLGAPQPVKDTPVPEPSSLLMLTTAGFILLGVRRVTKRQSTGGATPTGFLQ